MQSSTDGRFEKLMNRKQEIAAWVFGLLIALGLFVTDNVIWAIIVLAGLTILSLRDRQKKRQKEQTTIQAATPKDFANPVDPRPKSQ
jgi:hypothetical protein